MVKFRIFFTQKILIGPPNYDFMLQIPLNSLGIDIVLGFKARISINDLSLLPPIVICACRVLMHDDKGSTLLQWSSIAFLHLLQELYSNLHHPFCFHEFVFSCQSYKVEDLMII
jgi:hypothetical protein